MLRRDLGELAEFLTVTLWESLDAVRAFAGDDYETALLPGGRALPGGARREVHVLCSGRLPAVPVTVSRRVRPLRLAFLADARDHAMFLRVMRLCACRWGGRYNTIVPVFARRPSWHRDLLYRRHSAKDFARGQLESFEPDFIVECRGGLAGQLGVPGTLVVGIDEVDRETERGSVTYGIGAFSVFRHFFEREFEFVRRFQPAAVVPRPAGNADALLVASVFGMFPEARPARVRRRRGAPERGARVLGAGRARVGCALAGQDAHVQRAPGRGDGARRSRPWPGRPPSWPSA
jgi:hypothetical protein